LLQRKCSRAVYTHLKDDIIRGSDISANKQIIRSILCIKIHQYHLLYITVVKGEILASHGEESLPLRLIHPVSEFFRCTISIQIVGKAGALFLLPILMMPLFQNQLLFFRGRRTLRK
jgi:hypothetical protein